MYRSKQIKNMNEFDEYISTIDNLEHQERMKEVLNWVVEKYPNLKTKIGWNQPMFTDHGTFIIGFSVSKNHLAIAPEKVVIDYFSDQIKEVGYDHTMQLIRVKWDKPFDYSLLERIIDYNIAEKANCSSFWR